MTFSGICTVSNRNRCYAAVSRHLQVDVGTLVPGEADVTDLPRVARREHGLDGAARREHAIRIAHADDLVKLQQVVEKVDSAVRGRCG
jgi:hypothetical protein